MTDDDTLMCVLPSPGIAQYAPVDNAATPLAPISLEYQRGEHALSWLQRWAWWRDHTSDQARADAQAEAQAEPDHTLLGLS